MIHFEKQGASLTLKRALRKKINTPSWKLGLATSYKVKRLETRSYIKLKPANENKKHKLLFSGAKTVSLLRFIFRKWSIKTRRWLIINSLPITQTGEITLAWSYKLVYSIFLIYIIYMWTMFLNPCLFSFELHYAFFRVIRFLTNNPVDYGFLAVVFFIFLFTNSSSGWKEADWNILETFNFCACFLLLVNILLQ